MAQLGKMDEGVSRWKAIYYWGAVLGGLGASFAAPEPWQWMLAWGFLAHHLYHD